MEIVNVEVLPQAKDGVPVLRIVGDSLTDDIPEKIWIAMAGEDQFFLYTPGAHFCTLGQLDG